MITLFEENKDCYGCTACMNVCPVDAITMEYDPEGFLYPSIRRSSCIDCGKCREVCPAGDSNLPNDGRLPEPAVHGFKHKDPHVRACSSSGGAYTAISDAVIDHFGKSVLYGAYFDRNFNVVHGKASSRSERDAFRGSKYVQSKLGYTFRKISTDLRNSFTVLFTGTPCQVTGLLKFLKVRGIDTSGLITNDLICFGTPSPLLWQEYLKFIGRRSALSEYSFRYKGRGLNEAHNIHAEFRDKTIRDNTPDLLTYERLFGAALTLRPCCYHCPFASINRPSDITIGDFPTIAEAHPGFNDGLGISLVMSNTKKGNRILDLAREKGDVIRSTMQKCLQNRLRGPAPEPARRALFWSDYRRYGFIYVAKKYAGYDFQSRVKQTVKNMLGRIGLRRPPGQQRALLQKRKIVKYRRPSC